MQTSKYILALDLGTTGNRAFIFDAEGKILGNAYKQLTQHYPQPGWVEHNPEEIWNDTCWVIQTAIANSQISPTQIAAIGLTVQRETCLLWDKNTGKPLHNAIVWQDRRTAPLCYELQNQGYTQEVCDRTGLIIDAYFSATKLKWDMTARGAFLGITGGTQPAHLVRAVLEAIAYQVKEVVEAINASSDTAVQKLAVDGGACENNFLMQFQADILGIPVERPVVRDVTVQGVAFAAGLAVGLWDSYEELVINRQIDDVFQPKNGKSLAQFTTWKKAVERTKNWVDS
ncbi:MAG: hypothetical protein HC903_01500 [Methylacidiphilales bacterium]|nr:hypothetical protein [Candidatus Methylacidiphilales bacterium]NJR17689.1 hypothetical protein [Calothrix sp. CSU_2_0]